MSLMIDGKKISLAVDEREVDFTNHDDFQILTQVWQKAGWINKYIYQFTWLGRPIIQLPEDMIHTQEIIYQVKPTLIIETGVAHGGSLIFYASLLKLINSGRIVGIDIEIRPHNRKAIEEHELSSMITLIEGSSIDDETVNEVEKYVQKDDVVLVLLDSCHTKAHVLEELRKYAKFVTVGSYIVATDGIMRDLADAPRGNHDWDWNNPEQAAKEFLEENDNFILDNPKPIFNESNLDAYATHWPNAWLKRIR